MLRFALTAGLVTAIIIGATLAPQSGPKAAAISADVYKTSTCNCCAKWVELLQQDADSVRVHNLQDLSAIKSRYGVPPKLRSCHTTLVDGYVFEGHVPIDLLRGVLRDRPGIVGLAVPGMPIGSPGMEVAGQKQRYNVIAFRANGATETFAER
jgi:hypothetical protein